ncbi:MAG TPA: carboxypeptidase-like regulatory domain-containing protein [Tepidisphaeraceae bacterium]|jgi:protocatechuate 3,4-dioxygenase beta subunit
MRCIGLGLITILTLTFISQAAPPPAPTGPTITIQVTDKATGDPIPQATITAAGEHTTTDDMGQATLVVSERRGYFNIDVSKDGYVAMGAQWSNLKPDEKLPDQLTFNMEPGTSMGGKVVDENGNPVSGATVDLISPRQGGGAQGEVHSYFRSHAHTNDQGLWSINSAPAEVEMVDYMVQASGFFFDQVYRQGPPVSEYRNRTAVLKITRAATITGTVLGPDGHPIAGAAITAGDQNWGGIRHRTTTDSQGQFTLNNLRPGDSSFAVLSKQFAPQIVNVHTPTTQPAVVHLSAGTTLRLHVVDSSGKPLPEVQITLDQWNNANYVDYTLNTDANGDATWAGAPADEVTMSFTKRRFGSIIGKLITATTQPIQITLGPKTKVTATVVDAATGQPVANFDVRPGIKWQNNDQVYWVEENAGWGGNINKGDNGQFTYTPTQAYPDYELRVTAPGYLPSDSQPFDDDAGDLHLQFKLEKGASLAGMVYDPGHKPVANATIYLVVPGRQLQLITHGLVSANGQDTAQTDAGGHYSFPAQADAFDLICSMPQGFAMLEAPALHPEADNHPNQGPAFEANQPPTTRPSSYDLNLQAWATVQGKCMVGSKPAAIREMGMQIGNRFYRQNWPQVYWDYRMTTNAEGQFTFDHVPPGPIQICKVIHTGDSWSYSDPTSADVKPGETLTLQIGGVGRPVVGKFALPSNFKPGQWIAWSASLQSGPNIQTEPPMPLGVRIGSLEAKRKWLAAWAKTPEGAKFIAERRKAAAQMKNYALEVEPDGSFKAEDIPAGKYSLNAQFYPSDVQQTNSWNHPLGNASKRIEVPTMPGGRSDEPLDVGTVPIVTQPISLH